MNRYESSWFYSFIILLISIGCFFLWKMILPEKLFPEKADFQSEFRTVDEWLMDAMKVDTMENIEDDFQDMSDVFVVADTLLKEENSTVRPDTTISSESSPESIISTFLNHFYSRLYAQEKNPTAEKVRIAYFGDSMVDGDLIVQDIRRKYQEKYGGRGVGLVAITSESASSRASIRHSYSANWKTFSFMNKSEDYLPYGVHGMVSYVVDSINPTRLAFKSGVNATNFLLPSPVLFYGQSENDSATVIMRLKDDTISYRLKPEHLVNTLQLSDRVLPEMELEFAQADSIPFYGVNFDGSIGVQVDNYSGRGNSGLPLGQLDHSLAQAFQQELHYDLIVLQYGTNVLSSTMFNYTWYRARMGRVVEHLRQLFPETSILIISIADKATKYDGEMRTDSAVTYMIEAQQAYANEKQAAFINLYELMGGEGSMVRWVEEEPIRANKDYTHFNPFGAREIAHKIFKELERGYEQFKEEHYKEEEKNKNEDSIDSIEIDKEMRDEETDY